MDDLLTVTLVGDLYTIWNRGDATVLQFRTRNPYEAVKKLQEYARDAAAKQADYELSYYDYQWYEAHHIIAAYSLQHARLLQFLYINPDGFDEYTYESFNKSDYDELTLINYDEPGVY
jgi:hypothetical protein